MTSLWLALDRFLTQREWWNTKHQWIYYAYQHFCILLQILMINTVESWHSFLKHHAKDKKIMFHFSLADAALHVMTIAKQWIHQVIKKETTFWTTHYSECKNHLDLILLFDSVQKLIIDQMKLTMKQVEVNEKLWKKTSDELVYHCIFFH